MYIQADGTWRDYICTRMLTGFVCNSPDWINIETYQEIDFMGVYGRQYSWTWNEANEYCNDSYGTQLAIIETDEDNVLAYSTLANMNAKQGWIGVTIASNTMNIDDNKTGSSNGSNGELNSESGDNSNLCGFYSDTRYDSSWDYGVCNETKLKAFVCDLDVYSVFYCMCDDEWDYNVNDSYYGLTVGRYVGVFISGYDTNWNESNNYCNNEFGTQLASIHSQFEMEIIMTMLGNNNITQKLDFSNNENTNALIVWIGLQLNSDSAETYLEWIDDTQANYTNWQGDVDDSSNNNNSAQSGDSTSSNNDIDSYCVSMNVFSGEWIVNNCSNRYSVFICNFVNVTGNGNDDEDDIFDDIWDFVQENTMLVLIAAAVLFTVFLCCCIYCKRIRSRKSKRKTRNNNVAIGKRKGTESQAEQTEMPPMKTTKSTDKQDPYKSIQFVGL